jgi:hypothetical protein
MSNIINIVCLKWGTKYGAEYVNNLYASVKRNSTKKFKFWCFTENGKGVNPEVTVVPLPYSNLLHTWWNKLYLFSNDIPIPLGEKIFYVDLDTVIVDNIDDLLEVKTGKQMIILRDFYHGIAKSANALGSGLMCWQHGRYRRIWTTFIKNIYNVLQAANTYGDQWYIEQHLKQYQCWQDLFPDRVVSFKVHCRNGLPDRAAIICYHGRPSIPESITTASDVGRWKIDAQPWVQDFWHSRERCDVRHVQIPARDIFGMVGRCGGGYNSLWEDWSPAGRAARQSIMEEFEQELEKICGHYSKLEASLLQEGVRNPVVITCGYPKRRNLKHLPPELRSKPESQLLLLEGTTGGSRLHIAQKHNLMIDCIVNDWTGRYSHCPLISSEADARQYYTDQPDSIKLDPLRGTYTEAFDNQRKSYHLGDEWSEDHLMPIRAPMWIKILNKHGYTIDRLSTRVKQILTAAGINQ